MTHKQKITMEENEGLGCAEERQRKVVEDNNNLEQERGRRE